MFLHKNPFFFPAHSPKLQPPAIPLKGPITTHHSVLLPPSKSHPRSQDCVGCDLHKKEIPPVPKNPLLKTIKARRMISTSRIQLVAEPVPLALMGVLKTPVSTISLQQNQHSSQVEDSVVEVFQSGLGIVLMCKIFMASGCCIPHQPRACPSKPQRSSCPAQKKK